MSLMMYNREEQKAICEFMQDILKSSSKCQHCVHHDHTINGLCFNPYKCMTNDFSEYKEGD